MNEKIVAALNCRRASSRSAESMQASLCPRLIAAFDFDGTLTTADTLTAFIRFTHGRRRLLLGILCHAHWLLMMKLGLYPPGKAKERLFAHFYRGTKHEQFAQWGRDFADVAETMVNGQTAGLLRQHLAEGHTVCVVTASIDEWVRPLCARLGVTTVLATGIEVTADGMVTGRFLTPNCCGRQKVERLLELFPRRQSYRLYAYGDSSGDDELLAMADEGFRLGRRRIFGIRPLLRRS